MTWAWTDLEGQHGTTFEYVGLSGGDLSDSPSVLHLVSNQVILDTPQNPFLFPPVDVDPLVEGATQAVIEQPGTLHRGILRAAIFINCIASPTQQTTSHLETERVVDML